MHRQPITKQKRKTSSIWGIWSIITWGGRQQKVHREGTGAGTTERKARKVLQGGRWQRRKVMCRRTLGSLGGR